MSHIQSNEEILREDEGNTCGRKDYMLAAKEVLLNGSCDKRTLKYGLFDNSRTHGKTTSPLRKSQWHSRRHKCTNT